MYFQSFDSLRLFVIVAQYQSFTAAGQALHLTKGAISYKIKMLERELGFDLFLRLHNRVVLTEKGQKLLALSQKSFDDLEKGLGALQRQPSAPLRIGTSTYFAARWLASRLKGFMRQPLHVKLYLQPIVGIGDLKTDQLDFMIRWGKGGWDDGVVEQLFPCPACVTAGNEIAEQVRMAGIESTLPALTLLHDSDASEAWSEWHEAANLDYQPTQNGLVIPDPNVRVEAVANGQGVALNDALVAKEIETGRLFQISPVTLDDYGYFLIYSESTLDSAIALSFYQWILNEAAVWKALNNNYAD